MPIELGEQLVALLPRLRRYALTLCRARDQADDLVQGACERALTTRSERVAEAPFDAWMFTIVRNLWLDTLRKRKSEGTTVDIDDHHELQSGDGRVHTEATLTLARVNEHIARLPADQREVLFLVCVEDLSYKEAAALTGVPIGTVMSRLARARIKLAEASGFSLRDSN